MFETVLDSIYQEVVVAIALGAGGLSIKYFRSNRDKIDDICDRMTNVEKAVGLMAKLIAMQTRQDHPNSDTTELDQIVDIVLKDD